MDYFLRTASQSDAGHIRALVKAVNINPLGLDWRRFTLAVTPQGDIIGCGQIKLHRDGSAELASIGVLPAWRGRGVARAIIEHLLEDNPGALYLTCRASLQPFYAQYGFEVTEDEQLPKYFARVKRLFNVLAGVGWVGEELLVMRREALSDP